MEWVDAHCHLGFPPLSNDLAGVLERADRAGVGALIATAYDRRSWDVLDALPARGGVCVAYGVHPWVAGEGCDLDGLRRRATSARCVAIGEVGLDFAPGRPAPDVQQVVLAAQLGLAADLELPVVLHCHKAFDALFELLERAPVRGLVHGFAGSAELAGRCRRAGLLVGIGGRVTDPRASKLRDAVARLPDDGFLLETDAPDGRILGLEPGVIEPCHVVGVGRACAELRGVSLDRIARSTTDHARALFSLDRCA